MATDWRDGHIEVLEARLAETREALVRMIESYRFLVTESPLARLPVAVGVIRGSFLPCSIYAARVLTSDLPAAPGEPAAGDTEEVSHDPL